MYFTKPDPYLKPSYLISPFNNSFIGINNSLIPSDYCINYLNERFGDDNWIFTINGREAIRLIYQNINKSNLITKIVTTSNNKYISGCVTDTISNFGNWSRNLHDQFEIIFINHEFGFRCNYSQNHEDSFYIEDFCTSFFLDSEYPQKENRWSIYSLPKFFPIQIGGILVSKNIKNRMSFKSSIEKQDTEFIVKTLSFQLKNIDQLIYKRCENQRWLNSEFKKLGFESKFIVNEIVVPYIYLFKSIERKIFNWDALKVHFYSYGIQCSVFYGDEAFFIPTHQELTSSDLKYFVFVMESYLKSI